MPDWTKKNSPAWAAVKTGLFGRKHTLVPMRDAELAGDNEVRVPLRKRPG